MKMLSKIKIGVLYEFRLYRHHPILLLKENYLIALCFLLTIMIIALIKSESISINESTPNFVMMPIVLFLACNYFSPTFMIISKIHGGKKNRFRRFLIVLINSSKSY